MLQLMLANDSTCLSCEKKSKINFTNHNDKWFTYSYESPSDQSKLGPKAMAKF